MGQSSGEFAFCPQMMFQLPESACQMVDYQTAKATASKHDLYFKNVWTAV